MHSVAGGVITGVQWAVLSQTGPGVAWAVVLWLPAFLAGATVTRLLSVLRIVARPTTQGARYPRRAGSPMTRRSATNGPVPPSGAGAVALAAPQ